MAGRKPLAPEPNCSVPSEPPDFANREDLIICILQSLYFDSLVIVMIFFACQPQTVFSDVSRWVPFFSSFRRLLGRFQVWRQVRFKIITFSCSGLLFLFSFGISLLFFVMFSGLLKNYM